MINRRTDNKNNWTDQNGMDLNSETILFWKDYAAVDVSPEDTREMIDAVVNYFTLLEKWDL